MFKSKPVNHTWKRVNQTWKCVNQTWKCVNQTWKCVNQTRKCVNQTRKCVNQTRKCVNQTWSQQMLLPSACKKGEMQRRNKVVERDHFQVGCGFSWIEYWFGILLRQFPPFHITSHVWYRTKSHFYPTVDVTCIEKFLQCCRPTTGWNTNECWEEGFYGSVRNEKIHYCTNFSHKKLITTWSLYT